MYPHRAGRSADVDAPTTTLGGGEGGPYGRRSTPTTSFHHVADPDICGSGVVPHAVGEARKRESRHRRRFVSAECGHRFTDGTRWIQQQGGQKQEIKPGDVIWTPPGVKHWHGATATNGMTHLAITESLDGRNVDWMEMVSDAQYRK